MMIHSSQSRSSKSFGLAALTLAAMAGLASSASAQLVQTINYTNFNSVAGLQLNGTTTQTPGLALEPNTLSLTLPATANTGQSQVGTVYHNNKQLVDQGFVCDFKFRMRDRNGVGADGMTFIIQNDSATAMGASGGALGFATNLAFPAAGTGIGNSLAIAFDTWDNSTNWSTIPGANVITVQTNGLLPNVPSSDKSLGGQAVSGAFNDAAIHQVRVSYTPGVMSIYFDNLAVPVFNVPVNLANTLSLDPNGSAWVGFTAATGARINAQRHELIDWQFSSVVPAPGVASLLALGGLAALRRRR